MAFWLKLWILQLKPGLNPHFSKKAKSKWLNRPCFNQLSENSSYVKYDRCSDRFILLGNSLNVDTVTSVSYQWPRRNI